MLDWELGKQKELNAETPTAIDITTPTTAMPKSTTA